MKLKEHQKGCNQGKYVKIHNIEARMWATEHVVVNII